MQIFKGIEEVLKMGNEALEKEIKLQTLTGCPIDVLIDLFAKGYTLEPPRTKGYRALSQCLGYQNAIIAILKTQNLKEIEINDNLLYAAQDEIEVLYTHNHTTKIRIKEKKANG